MSKTTTLVNTRAADNNFATKLNGRKFSEANQYVELSVGVVSSVTVPSFEYENQNYIAFINIPSGAFVWVQPSALPVLTAPTGTVAETTAQLNPECRVVNPGQVLQFLYSGLLVGTPTTVQIGIEYYNDGKMSYASP